MAMASWKTLESIVSHIPSYLGRPGCSQTESLVSLGVALATIEQVLLDIFQDREPGAASCVCGSVNAVGARNTPGDSTCSSCQYLFVISMKVAALPLAAWKVSTTERAATSCLKAMANGRTM
jgi:hypothetical protein